MVAVVGMEAVVGVVGVEADAGEEIARHPMSIGQVGKKSLIISPIIGNRLFYFQTNPINKKHWQKKSEVK